MFIMHTLLIKTVTFFTARQHGLLC